MKKAVLLSVFACLASGAAAQTTLRPGDIALLGYNADNPDQFAFVPLVDLEAGTAIAFTDNGWQSEGAFRSGEGTVTWTADAAVARGTVVALTSGETGFNASVGTVSPGGGPRFSEDGDQLLAYQGEEAAPAFLYALNNEGDAWQADATSSNDSALPAGLENGTTAVALSEVDNAAYTGPTSGTRVELLAATGDPANWTGDNGERVAMPTGPFEVTDAGTELVSIEMARQLPEGTRVTTQGTVTRAKGGVARIQAENAGLTIRQTSGPFAEAVADGSVAAGDVLRITGTLSESNELKVIEGEALQSFEVVSRGNALPEPQDVTLFDLVVVPLSETEANGESYESELVRTAFALETDDETFQADTAYPISDETTEGGEVTLYIPPADQTDLDGQPISAARFTFTGVLGQFVEGAGGPGLPARRRRDHGPRARRRRRRRGRGGAGRLRPPRQLPQPVQPLHDHPLRPRRAGLGGRPRLRPDGPRGGRA